MEGTEGPLWWAAQVVVNWCSIFCMSDERCCKACEALDESRSRRVVVNESKFALHLAAYLYAANSISAYGAASGAASPLTQLHPHSVYSLGSPRFAFPTTYCHPMVFGTYCAGHSVGSPFGQRTY
ncbi:hypothetical protein FRC12_017559 [Ceratobasidium sp. 428]|nr:hypothetical protein FRC12_017559 [Ceratobasidium sp. 428]